MKKLSVGAILMHTQGKLWNSFFFIVLLHRSWGVPFGELEQFCEGIFLVFWWILVGWKNWKISIYDHLCCSTGYILIIQKILVGEHLKMIIYVHLGRSTDDILIIQRILVWWKFENCPFMLQYGWYFDNPKGFSGMTIWKMSIYVHLWCSTGYILIIQKILVGWKFRKWSFMSM
jgi:hypothetical protein